MLLCRIGFEPHVKGDTTMRQFFPSVGLALVLFALPQAAQADIVANMDVPFPAIPQPVPCANGGAGEDVTFAGNVHLLASITMDNAGGAHVYGHENFQDVSGVGSVTGDKYQATGSIQIKANVTIAQEATVAIRFNAIGPGPDNNLYIDATAHITINANGTMTASFTDVSIVCK
jgi:hypothetical protein